MSGKFFEYKRLLGSQINVFLLNDDIVKFKGADCLVNCTGPNFEQHGNLNV